MCYLLRSKSYHPTSRSRLRGRHPPPVRKHQVQTKASHDLLFEDYSMEDVVKEVKPKVEEEDEGGEENEEDDIPEDWDHDDETQVTTEEILAAMLEEIPHLTKLDPGVTFFGGVRQTPETAEISRTYITTIRWLDRLTSVDPQLGALERLNDLQHEPGKTFNPKAFILGSAISLNDISDLTTRCSAEALAAAADALKSKFGSIYREIGLAAVSPKLRHGLVAIQGLPS
jgi:hypothetical protein